jgi:hypothetical protein
MLPMSSLPNATMPGFPGMPQALPPQANMMHSFAGSGIPNFNGGFAYPPGSEMAQFLDHLNGTVASATRGPDGGSVLNWATGLAQQAAMRQQAALQQAQAAAAQAAEAAQATQALKATASSGGGS